MCSVYQAWDTRLQRYVAVKRLEPPLNEDPRTRARFDREGRALAQLSHPNLVTLIDRGTTEDEDYLVFEYVEGRSLKEVKPQNIFIDQDGHAKVGDFGIATGPDWTRVTRAGTIIGSARYMSPEQVRSKPVDRRSDIYSLGIVLYEMLAGHPPFDGTNMPEIARQHLSAPPPPFSEVRDDLPPGLERVVMRCLEKLPEDRFSSMDELLGALVGLGLYVPQWTAQLAPSRRLLGRRREDTLQAPARGDTAGTPAEKLIARLRSRARKKRRTHRWRAVALATVLVIGVAVVLAVALPGKGAPLLVGKTLGQAQQLATSSGYRVEVSQQVPSFDKAGMVLDQSPKAGKKPDNGAIDVTATRSPVPVKVARLQDVDPQGDAHENHAMLPNLIDGKANTYWSTELYKSSSFGNLKTGVGVDFTLGSPATIVEVDSPVKGWKGELLPKTSAGVGTKIATLDGVALQRITLQQPITSGRIWITQLVELKPGQFGMQLSELRFYR
jgi:serine/threonine-protein kinase